MVGILASLFLGQNVRPLILLDSDEAGRVRRDALMKELYVGHVDEVVMLGDVLKVDDCEMEDLLGEAVVLAELNKVVSTPIKVEKQDRTKGGVVDQIKAAANRLGVQLPDGWKAEVARRLVTQWASKPDSVAAATLRKASTLFAVIRERFERQNAPTK
jgi:hypothetical protein